MKRKILIKLTIDASADSCHHRTKSGRYKRCLWLRQNIEEPSYLCGLIHNKPLDGLLRLPECLAAEELARQNAV